MLKQPLLLQGNASTSDDKFEGQGMNVYNFQVRLDALATQAAALADAVALRSLRDMDFASALQSNIASKPSRPVRAMSDPPSKDRRLQEEARSPRAEVDLNPVPVKMAVRSKPKPISAQKLGSNSAPAVDPKPNQLGMKMSSTPQVDPKPKQLDIVSAQKPKPKKPIGKKVAARLEAECT